MKCWKNLKNNFFEELDKKRKRIFFVVEYYDEKLTLLLKRWKIF